MLEGLRDFLIMSKVRPDHVKNHISVLIASFNAVSSAEAISNGWRNLYYIAETEGEWYLYYCESMPRYCNLSIWGRPKRLTLCHNLDRQCTVTLRDDGKWMAIGHPSWALSGKILTFERSEDGWVERGAILPPDSMSYNFGAKVRILNSPEKVIIVEYRKRTSCPSEKYTFTQGAWKKN